MVEFDDTGMTDIGWNETFEKSCAKVCYSCVMKKLNLY